MTYKNGKIRNMTLRTVAILTAVIMMFTAAPTAIALETFRTAMLLTEQTFTLYPEEGVTVTLEGVMPADGHAEAQPADIEGDDVLHAYDITIYYANGKEFEPDESRPIGVSFQSDTLAGAIADGDTAISVEHITQQ